MGHFTLIETRGQNAVSVFANPAGAARAPTAGLNVADALATKELDDGEFCDDVLGACALQSCIVILCRCALMRVVVDNTVSIAEVAKPKSTSGRLPLGMNPEAVLRMLDNH